MRMPDGQLTSMDNTRARTAREAGINVEAREWKLDDPLSQNNKERFEVNDVVPDTLGEALQLKIQKRKPKRFGNENPFDSHELPKLTEKKMTIFRYGMNICRYADVSSTSFISETDQIRRAIVSKAYLREPYPINSSATAYLTTTRLR